VPRWLLYLLGWEIGWHAVQLYQRGSFFSQAQAAALAVGKPFLVVGTPRGQYPCGDVVLDLEAPPGECPVEKQGSIESIPYPDKHFGAVFVSHVVEHVCDPVKSLQELRRVADKVFIVYPYPWRLTMLLVPGHAWLVLGSNEQPKFVPWFRGNCNVPTHYGTKPDAAPVAASTPTTTAIDGWYERR